MATKKKDTPVSPTTPVWSPTSAVLLRQYRDQTKDELIEKLRSLLPKTPPPDKLFELPGKAIVRRQLFREGAEHILTLIERLSKEDVQPESADNGGFESMS